MFTTPPPGHHTAAIATIRPPTTWTAGVLFSGLAAFTLVIIAALNGLLLSGMISGPLGGLVALGTVGTVGTRYYACGQDWFRRGGRHVRLHELTRIAIISGRVILIDARQERPRWVPQWALRWLRRGRVSFPLQTVLDDQALYGALRAGIHTALTRREVLVTPSAVAAFDLDIPQKREAS